MSIYFITLKNNSNLRTMFFHKKFTMSKAKMIEQLLNMNYIKIDKYVIYKIQKLK